MIGHHLIHALRRLRKNTTYTLLNAFGLSVGLACFAMIGLWMKSELTRPTRSGRSISRRLSFNILSMRIRWRLPIGQSRAFRGSFSPSHWYSWRSPASACSHLYRTLSSAGRKRSGYGKCLAQPLAMSLAMLSREFLLLVALSSFVAVPVGYYFMSEWLTGFAYHASLNALMFVTAGVAVLVVAWITVGLRTFRAASSNPVRSLRSE
jgi:hypothetical protein